MTISDTKRAVTWLETVGHYRLSAYWLPYEKTPSIGQTRSKEFVEGTNFEDIIRIYVFDRKLRLLVLEATERLEVSLRSRWTYYFANKYGPHGFLNPNLFKSKKYTQKCY